MKHTQKQILFVIGYLIFSKSLMASSFCMGHFRLLADSAKTGDTTSISEGKADALWKAANKAYTAIDPGSTRVEGGRKLNVPPLVRFLVSWKLKQLTDSETAAAISAPPGKGDAIAIGNAGHLAMYEKLESIDSVPVENKFPKGAVQDIFGIDPDDFRAIVIAHDNDKQSPKPKDPLAERALAKLGGKMGAIEYAVGLHGQKSLQRVAQVIRELGQARGWSEEEQYQYFSAFADQIGGHNSGVDLIDLTPERIMAKYPSVNEAEAKALASSFYDVLVNQGGMFGNPLSVNARMGFGVSDRDGDARPILGRHLITLDRGTILDWKKVGGQNLMNAEFDPNFLNNTLNNTATGALALIKAVADMRRGDVLKGKGYYVDVKGNPVPENTFGVIFKPYTVEDLPSYQFFAIEGVVWQKAAARVAENNDLELRKAAGLLDSVDAQGRVQYEKAVLYQPEGSNRQYVVRGEYNRVDGKKVYEMDANVRTVTTVSGKISYGNWEKVKTASDARNPMEVLGAIMIEHGDLRKPL